QGENRGQVQGPSAHSTSEGRAGACPEGGRYWRDGDRQAAEDGQGKRLPRAGTGRSLVVAYPNTLLTVVKLLAQAYLHLLRTAEASSGRSPQSGAGAADKPRSPA